jgi:dihydrofolate reductase
MRKVIVSNMVTLDGFFAGANGEIDWFVTDDDFFEYAVDLLRRVDTILFGRVTYEGMASYWVTVDESDAISERMNNLPKVVFSKTLETVDWKHSRLATQGLAEEIQYLKQQAGKDMVVYGSGEIVSQLARLGLIDEYHLIVVPTILGKGKPLFESAEKPVNLNLLRSRTLNKGVIILFYEPAK